MIVSQKEYHARIKLRASHIRKMNNRIVVEEESEQQARNQENSFNLMLKLRHLIEF